MTAWGPWTWFIAGAAVLVALLVAWILWWWLPKHQVSRYRFADAKTRVDTEDNLRKTNGQLLGGAGLLIGAGIGATDLSATAAGARRPCSGRSGPDGSARYGMKRPEAGSLSRAS
jgi:hypothetical protein